MKLKNVAIIGGVALGAWWLLGDKGEPAPVAPAAPAKDKPSAAPAAPAAYGYGYQQPYYGSSYGYQQPYQYQRYSQYGYQPQQGIFSSLLSPLSNLFQPYPYQSYQTYVPPSQQADPNIAACQNNGGQPVIRGGRFVTCQYARGRRPAVAPYYPRTIGYGVPGAGAPGTGYGTGAPGTSPIDMPTGEGTGF